MRGLNDEYIDRNEYLLTREINWCKRMIQLYKEYIIDSKYEIDNERESIATIKSHNFTINTEILWIKNFKKSIEEKLEMINSYENNLLDYEIKLCELERNGLNLGNNI